MVNQIDSTRDFISDNPTRQRSDTYTLDRQRSNTKFRFDDLIVALANTHENQRARQVTEWEGMRRQNFPRSV